MRRNKRILIVDDNPVNLCILEEILSDDYRIDFATTGHKALSLARSAQPFLVLLDVMLPEMDGLEVCRRMRAIEGMRDAAIIMVSAKAMPSERAAGIEAGANEYLTKPFDEVELLEIIRHYSGEKGQAGDSFAMNSEDGEPVVFA
jgi:putative two-component system response regulator